MAAIKFDTGSGGYASNCFPVRGLIRTNVEEGGAWVSSHKAEQRRRFKAVLCNKPKTYSQIKAERKRSVKQGTVMSETINTEDTEDLELLDGFFLMKHCCVEDPADLCSVNICNQGLTEAKEEDLALFDNVAYVNAGENMLPFEAFRHLPILRELEIPLNGLRGIRINDGDFNTLELLDMSYNNLSREDAVTLGMLPNLKVLHLTGNGLTSLPPDLTRPYLSNDLTTEMDRFPKLDILMLDDNKFSDSSIFACLAGLKKLRHLSLERNEISSVPHLKLVPGKHIVEEVIEKKRTRPKSRTKNRKKPEKAKSDDASAPSAESEKDKDPTTSAVTSPEPETETFSEYAPTPDLITTSMPTAPFPALEHLNLAHNKISEEEVLLPLAGWPELNELVIHDNPLTTQRSGDPPLLHRFLQKRLGIKIIRKKTSPLSKPHIEVPNKPQRKVNTKVPTIPKRNVDELLALEAPPTNKTKEEIVAEFKPRPTSQPIYEIGKPLPPIASPQPASDGDEPEEEEEQPEARTEAWVDESNDNAFFMTQVDGQNANTEVTEDKQEKKKKRKKKIPAKYRGYNVLLDGADDAEIHVPQGIQNNIRALQHALNHPLVFRDNQVHLDHRQKPFKPHVKTAVPTSVERVSEQQKIDAVLHQMKTQKNIKEDNLQSVLDEGKFEDFPEAQVLLSQIQHRYNNVRASSMKNTRDAKEQLKSTIQAVGH
ncbi:unnamed protein product [Owenia fusiformis]|uniref:Uncharacterized protein n=1 Tax=Owenia fusiformis TaxID=6347 RepID=A0A8J1UE99_OWEFU|nr:unnamed protein product [Owenia fusiformis]